MSELGSLPIVVILGLSVTWPLPPERYVRTPAAFGDFFPDSPVSGSMSLNQSIVYRIYPGVMS
jgi:hypothetical protein